MKVPKALRDSVKLAAIGSEILWIIPNEGMRGRYSAAYGAEDNCERPIIVLEYSCRL
jgi:tRNA(Ile)-lysidine synthase